VVEPAGFSLRISSTPEGAASAFVRKHRFTVGAPVTFDEDDPHVSALEYVLGAFGGELVSGLMAGARARHLAVHHAEAVVKAELDDPLATLGVVGASGHPGLARVHVKLYASGDDEQGLRDLWKQTLERSTLVRTLRAAVRLELELALTP